MLINTAIFDTTIGEETVLLNEDIGQVILLNPIATLLWNGLKADLTVNDVAALIAEQSGIAETTVRSDLDELLVLWQKLDILKYDDNEPAATIESLATGADDIPMPCPAAVEADALRYLGTFGVGDVEFALHASDTEVQKAATQVFDHLKIDPVDGCHFTLSVERRQDEWLLFCDGEYEARCSSVRALAPMLHANTLLLVYQYSEAKIALHAAAVAVDQGCIIFPAKSGSGKSTLSAALVSEGFRFCSDDLVLLTGPDLTVVPVSFCIGLKEGAWGIASARSPAVADLVTHERIDGKTIRYLAPLPNTQIADRTERLQARLLVFPAYDQDCAGEHRSLSSGEALVRLTQSGYDIAAHLNRKILQQLITWIEDIPCVELRYNDLDYAIDYIDSLSTQVAAEK